MARTTVSAAVDELLARGVLRVAGTRPTAGRGRPADRLALSPRGGHVLLADVGARGAHLAVVDLSQQVVAHEHVGRRRPGRPGGGAGRGGGPAGRAARAAARPASRSARW